jgi:hypothetical protein
VALGEVGQSFGLFRLRVIDLAAAVRKLVGMTDTSTLIPELIRAANQVSKLTVLQKGSLLGKSIVAIREMNGRAAVSANPLVFDETIILQVAAATIDRLPDEAVTATLLKAADNLRNLKTVLDVDMSCG